MLEKEALKSMSSSGYMKRKLRDILLNVDWDLWLAHPILKSTL